GSGSPDGTGPAAGRGGECRTAATVTAAPATASTAAATATSTAGFLIHGRLARCGTAAPMTYGFPRCAGHGEYHTALAGMNRRWPVVRLANCERSAPSIRGSRHRPGGAGHPPAVPRAGVRRRRADPVPVPDHEAGSGRRGAVYPARA